MIIDLYSHLIPNIDDGAQIIEQSVESAKLAISERVKHIVLTSHHRNGKYINLKESVIREVEHLKKKH